MVVVESADPRTTYLTEYGFFQAQSVPVALLAATSVNAQSSTPVTLTFSTVGDSLGELQCIGGDRADGREIVRPHH